MYAQKEKLRENKSRAAANSVKQKKKDDKQGVEFIDKRVDAKKQKSLQLMIDKRNIQLNKNINGANNSIIQRFPKTDLKDSLGTEFLEKHISTAGFPSLSSREDQENVLESVYYHRPTGDRKAMNTVFFANPTALEQDLRLTADEELSYTSEFTTTNTYPAITVLRVYREDENNYAKGDIRFGDGRPVVKINKDDGDPSFNHLQKTNPKTLPNHINLLQ